jgi:hypothetical protein
LRWLPTHHAKSKPFSVLPCGSPDSFSLVATAGIKRRAYGFRDDA